MLNYLRNLLFAKPDADTPADTFNLRRWFIFFVVYLASLTAAAMLAMHSWSETNSPLMLRFWITAIYLFYLSLCCTFFPAPTAWIILLMASPVINLVDPESLTQSTGWPIQTANLIAPILTVTIAAWLGAAATAVANLNEYYIFTFLLRFGRVKKIRETRFYLWAKKFFDVSPFALLLLFSFLPVPVDVVRWLAISVQYSRIKYTISYFIGRFARYLILAGAAAVFQIGLKGVVIIQIVLAVLVLIRFVPRLMTKFKSQPLTDSEPCQSC